MKLIRLAFKMKLGEACQIVGPAMPKSMNPIDRGSMGRSARGSNGAKRQKLRDKLARRDNN